MSYKYRILVFAILFCIIMFDTHKTTHPHPYLSLTADSGTGQATPSRPSATTFPGPPLH